VSEDATPVVAADQATDPQDPQTDAVVEAEAAPVAVDFATATDDDLATLRSESDAIVTQHLGEGHNDLDPAAFKAALESLDLETLGVVVTALETHDAAAGEIASRDEKAAAARAEAIQKATSLRPASKLNAAAPVAASVSPGPRPMGTGSQLVRQFGSASPAAPQATTAPALSFGGPRVKAPTTIRMSTASGAYVAGSVVKPTAVVNAVTDLATHLIKSKNRQPVFSVEPEFGPPDHRGDRYMEADVAAGVACLPPEPDYAVVECGSDASQWERAFQVSRGKNKQTFRPALSGSLAVNEWDPQSDKTCVKDDCEEFITPDASTIYQCLTIENEAQWGDPDAVAAFIRRAERGWVSSANGRAWKFVKANSTQWTNTNANNRPVSALFASHFGADLAYMLDQLREDDTSTSGLTVLADRKLLWGIATDGVLRDLGPNNTAQAELDAIRIVQRLAPGATVIPMWDAPTPAGGPLWVGSAPAGGPGPSLAGQTGAFAIYRSGDFRRHVLGTLELGFEPADRFRGNENLAANTSQWFQELKYQDQFRGCFSVWHTVDICVNGAWPGPYDAVSSCNVDGVQP